MDAEKDSCLTKTAHLIEWQDASEVYSKAVAALSSQIGIISKDRYDQLRKEAESARNRSVEAQERLGAHVLEHG